MPINPQDNDNSKSSQGDNLFYLLKTEDSQGAGNRNEEGLAKKFFSDEDIAVLQNSIISQQLNPVEFKPGSAGEIKSSWANYLANGQDSFSNDSTGLTESVHNLTWNTNFTGDEATIVREREKAWATAVKSAWLGYVQEWYILAGGRVLAGENGIFTEGGSARLASFGITDATAGQPFDVSAEIGGKPGTYLTKFQFAFWSDISSVLSGPAGGPSLASGEILSYLEELSTTRSLAFGPGNESYYLFKSYYRYFDSETGERKENVPFPGNILDAINELYAPNQDTALEMMGDDVTSLYSIYNSVKGDLNNLQTNLGQIVRGELIVTGYENVNTQEKFTSIPPEDDPADYKALETFFDVFGDFRQSIKTEEYGIPTTILSGVRVNFELIKNKSLTGLTDTPSGNIIDHVLISNGSGFNYVPYHFTGILDTPTGYESGHYLMSSSSGIEYVPASRISDDLINYGIEKYITLTGLKDVADPSLDSNRGDQKYLKFTQLENGEYDISWQIIGTNETPDSQQAFTGLFDTPSTYVDQKGKYLKVKEQENGIEFSDIQSLEKDLNDNRFGVPDDAPSCISNLEEYQIYKDYETKFIGSNMGSAFEQMFNSQQRLSNGIFNACLHAQSNSTTHSNEVKIEETQYKWGIFSEPKTINILATPDNDCSFVEWKSNTVNISNPTNSSASLLIDSNTSITGHFICS